MQLLNLAVEVSYVLPEELDPLTKEPLDGATTWQLRCLTATEKGALDDSVVDFSQSRVYQNKDGTAKMEGGMSFSMSDRRINRVRIGLVGWDGLLDHEGKPVPYVQETFKLGSKTFKGAPMDVVQALPDGVIKALARKIAEVSGLSASEGNF